MPRAMPRFPTSDSLVGRFLIACMVLGFASLIAAGFAAAWSTTRNQEHTRWVNHTYEVELAISRIANLNEQAETARRGFLLTGQPVYRQSYASAVRDLGQAIDRMAELAGDNPRQQKNIARLRNLLAELAEFRALSVERVESGSISEAVQLFTAETNARRMSAIRDQTRTMAGEERRLLAIRDTEQRASIRTFFVVLGIAGAILLLVALVSFLTVKRYTRDLGRSRDGLRAFNDTLEDQVAERTADLTRANEEIQRFAYIVSHDLRSPLVNVMGFTAELSSATGPLAELVDRAEATAPEIVTEEARLAAREDLPEAIGFIRASTQKMDRLINAILKLSREGRRTITPEPLDLAALVAGIAASIQHILDDRGVALVVERPLPSLISDRLAIEQILSNLIENAAKYLQPGRPGRIVVSGRRERARVVLSVADNGRGIAASDHQRVFDLFRRSGSQDQPGEGIGLAHVRALAYRLGGTIDVVSTLGEGATFSLNLPAATQSEAKP